MTDETFEFDDTNYEHPPHDEPLTAENWFGYWHMEYDASTHMLTGHLDANNRTCSDLQKMIDKAESFDELKSELLNFIQQRKDFKKDVDKKWNGPKPEQWGFPARD